MYDQPGQDLSKYRILNRKMSGSSKGKNKVLQHDRMYAICRLDGNRHGQDAWAIRLSRGGKLIHMTFSDSTYGGREPALTVALAYRDAVLKVVPPMTKQAMRMIVRKNRSRGSRIPGVYYTAPGRGSKAGAWIARIEVTPPGACCEAGRRRRKAISRTFSVAKYGYDEARKLAEEERIRMVSALENGDDPALRSSEAVRLHDEFSQEEHSG